MATIRGDNRNNVKRGTDGRDTFYLYGGDDVASGGGGSDSIFAGAGADRLNGGGGNDFLYGDDGADLLFGGDGADRLYGGNGPDRLNGGTGGDFLVGGDGADRFVYDSVRADNTPTGFSIDTIFDFSRAEGDRIDLSGIDGNWSAPGDQGLRYIGRGAFSENGRGEVQIVISAGDTYVQIDANGDGGVDLGFGISGTPPINATDFIL